jgi:hypothetical protein
MAQVEHTVDSLAIVQNRAWVAENFITEDTQALTADAQTAQAGAPVGWAEPRAP